MEISSEINRALKDGSYYTKEYFTGEMRKKMNSGYGSYLEGKWYHQQAALLWHYFKPSKVFELGCATGWLLNALWWLNVDVRGMDISKWAVDNAMLKVKEFIQLGDGTSIKEGNKSFDLSIGIDVFEHIHPNLLTNVLDEFCRISDKWIYAIIPTPDSDSERSKQSNRENEISHASFNPAEFWLKEFRKRNFALFKSRHIIPYPNPFPELNDLDMYLFKREFKHIM